MPHVLVPAALLLALLGPQEFEERFTGRTLRFDYHHVGDASVERIAPDGLRLEGPWAGSRAQLADGTDLGKYRFLVRDAESGALLWSRGFCSLFGEWETTAEARETWRAFHASQRFPEPRSAVVLVLEKRGADGAFAELFRWACDPSGRAVDRSPLAAAGQIVPLFESGAPATKVDLLVVSDGYPAGQRDEFLADARRLAGALFGTEPFARRKGDFNLRALFVPAPGAGIANPRKGLWPGTALGLSFNAFDSDRYVLTYANRELREVVAQVPYDALILLFDSRKYGGGGIFNLWATCASDTEPAPYVFVHEFGHSFAGLADEYYSSPVSYEEFVPPGTEPWEPNVTALLDPQQLKWRDLVAPSTPLPTPWSKEDFDAVDRAFQELRAEKVAAQASEEEMDALFREVKERTRPVLEGDPRHGQVGAFEGAAYKAVGLYRPAVDCIMFTRNPTAFCPVCERAIERVIDLYAR